jgi:hypothetical protein
MLYYIIKPCEWCHQTFEQRAGNTIGRRTCSTPCRRALKEYTKQHSSMRANNKGLLKLSLQPLKTEIEMMREKNKDVFTYPSVSDSFNYTHEELSELFRYAQRMVASGHLRGNELAEEIEAGKHNEWGDALMMLMTIAIQMEIDPDKAIYGTIQKIYQRCENKRQELINANDQ